MSEDKERVIRAARRWAALATMDDETAMAMSIELVNELNDAVRAFEHGRKLRPLRPRPTVPVRSVGEEGK